MVGIYPLKFSAQMSAFNKLGPGEGYLKRPPASHYRERQPARQLPTSNYDSYRCPNYCPKGHCPNGREPVRAIDGYRLIVQRDGARVRLFTRNGHDWTGRYPLIVEAPLKNRQTSFVVDGEAVLLGVDSGEKAKN